MRQLVAGQQRSSAHPGLRSVAGRADPRARADAGQREARGLLARGPEQQLTGRADAAADHDEIGVGIANAINTFDPDLVVIGGGISAAGDLLLAPARAEAARFTLTGVGTTTRICAARYGPEAGVRGAALLASHELVTSSAGHRKR